MQLKRNTSTLHINVIQGLTTFSFRALIFWTNMDLLSLSRHHHLVCLTYPNNALLDLNGVISAPNYNKMQHVMLFFRHCSVVFFTSLLSLYFTKSY